MNPGNYVNRNISFEPDILDKLEELAEIEERSVSATVRMAVKQYIRRKEEELRDFE